MILRLVDLEAAFVEYVDERHTQDRDGLAGAHGVRFLCPACFKQNGGAVGTHSVLVWFANRGVPDAATPGPGRWEMRGDGLHNLTLSPSVHLRTGCQWHGHVVNGCASIL